MNYKIRSKVGKVSVVHHDHLKVSQIPFGNGQVIATMLGDVGVGSFSSILIFRFSRKASHELAQEESFLTVIRFPLDQVCLN